MNETAATHLIAQLITYLGTTPVLLFAAIILLFPTAIQIWANYKQDRRMTAVFERQDKRFEQVVKMYEDNVDLVKAHQQLVEGQQVTQDKMIELVQISTATQQTLVDYIKNNWWCPVNKDPSLLRTLTKEKQA